jgi:hypothetical protein
VPASSARAPTRSATSLDLEDVIAPLDVGAFAAGVWDNETRVFPHHDPARYASLFSVDAAETLVSSPAYRTDALRLMTAGAIVPTARYARAYRRVRTLLDPERISRLYADGATLEFNALERFWPPLDAFCARLQERLGCPVGAGAFLSPGARRGHSASRALDAHYDSMDLFVLQVSGRKRWRLYDAPWPRPLDDQTWQEGAHVVGAPTDELILEPGDAMYLLRGTVHDALTLDDHSLHLAISVFPTRLLDLLVAAVEALGDDPRFRASVPMSSPGVSRSDAVAASFARAAELAGTTWTDASAQAAIDRRLAAFARPPRRAHLGTLQAD